LRPDCCHLVSLHKHQRHILLSTEHIHCCHLHPLVMCPHLQLIGLQ
jgi:hypothetical protein